MSEWQPIETAPKDGTSILVWRRNQVLVAHWDIDKYAKTPRPYWGAFDVWNKTSNRLTPPTHWMPMPRPPVSA